MYPAQSWLVDNVIRPKDVPENRREDNGDCKGLEAGLRQIVLQPCSHCIFSSIAFRCPSPLSKSDVRANFFHAQESFSFQVVCRFARIFRSSTCSTFNQMRSLVCRSTTPK